MQFTLKSAFVLALFASTTSVFAAPLDVEARDSSSLEARASRKPRVLVSCNGTPYTPDQITAAMNQAKALENAGYTYPEPYGNMEGGQQLFPANSQLWSFPLTDPVWTSKFSSNMTWFLKERMDTNLHSEIGGMSPGGARVVMDINYNYQGSMVHIATSGLFQICG
jgi:hypothetical protein